MVVGASGVFVFSPG
jgi:hypothetical protein